MPDLDHDPLTPPRTPAAAAAQHRVIRPGRTKSGVLRAAGKGIERGLKVVIFGTLRVLMRLGSPARPPKWSARPHRVLLLRYERIGDMILMTGVIRAIVEAQPSVSCDVLASPGNADVLTGNPYVRNVLVLKKRQIRSLLSAVWHIRRNRYDAVLDPMFPRPSFTNMILMWLSGAPYRIGISGRGNDYALTLPVAPAQGAVHHIDHTGALSAAFGVDVERISRAAAAAARPAPLAGAALCKPATGWGVWPSQIHLSASEARAGEARWGPRHGPVIRLVVNVSVSSDERRWPEERFIEAVNHVQARFPQVLPLLVGATTDADRMEHIARSTGVEAAHTPHYRQMMAIVAASDLVLTGDTSVTHVACAFGKPVLALFPGGGGAAFGPYSGGYTLATSAPTLAPLPAEPVLRGLAALILEWAPVARRSA